MATSALQLAAAGAGRPSRSTAVVMGSVSGHHIFSLKGYSQTKEIGNGQYMTLGAFDLGGHSWSLRYYPNGHGFFDTGYISLFLSRDNDLCSSGMPARFRLSFVNQNGKPVPSFSHTSGTRTFNKSHYGYGQFIKREVFEKSACLKDDSFAIRCDIFVAAMEEATKEDTEGLADLPPAIVPPKSDLQRDLTDLLWNKQGTDVIIEVGGRMFPAHKWLLAARSMEFKEKFFGSQTKKTVTQIQIDDMEVKVFESLLHFMYTDTLPEMDEEAMAAMAKGLLAAADKYKLERLKMMCEEMLCKRIDLSTVEASLVLSEQHHCPTLKAKCMEFLTSPGNLKAVMASDGFEIVKKRCPTVLLEFIMKQFA